MASVDIGSVTAMRARQTAMTSGAVQATSQATLVVFFFSLFGL